MSNIFVEFGDITKQRSECIVNSAKKSLGDGGGVCGAIYKAAGRFRLKLACMLLGGCEVGEAKITPGFKLHADYIIHTVGPNYNKDSESEIPLLKCYINSLRLARNKGIHVISFPVISSGINHYPPKHAVKIAFKAIRLWIKANSDYNMKIVICCDNEECYDLCYDELHGEGKV